MSDTDRELLARYTRHRAEDDFAELVRRHLGLVYSAALRQVRSPQLAEEIAQSTFIKLALQARHLAPDTILTAWLYQVSRREAIDVVRRESRRQLREQIAIEMNAMNATDTEWTQIKPLLDEAMYTLDDTDRNAVLLRYFENKSLRQVGATLGTSEDAAQKRLSRAVERLREFFSKRGVTIGASGLIVAISASAVQAAPAGLAGLIVTSSLLKHTSLITKGTLLIMAWSKRNTLVASAIVLLFAGGITAIVVQQIRHTQRQALANRAEPIAGGSQANTLVNEDQRADSKGSSRLAQAARAKAALQAGNENGDGTESDVSSTNTSKREIVATEGGQVQVVTPQTIRSSRRDPPAQPQPEYRRMNK